MVELLLNKTLDVDAKDNLGRTPLYLAAAAGQDEIMEVLIKAGADVNLRNNYSYTPLLTAATAGEYTFIILMNCLLN